MAVAVSSSFWLDELEELFAPLAESYREPLSFVLGGSTSCSSGGPTTAQIIAARAGRKPRSLDLDEAARELTGSVPHEERQACLDPLFQDMVPFVGYRCVGALARRRAVTIVTLSWDDCARQGALLAGVPKDEIDVVDLREVDTAGRQLQALHARGRGLLVLHVNGSFADLRLRELRFEPGEQRELQPKEIALLRQCLRQRTIVAGLSLARQQANRGLLEALDPNDAGAAQMWVVERGDPTSPSKAAEISATRLSGIMTARRSARHRVITPAADFDLTMATLRAVETGRTWKQVVEKADARLPHSTELVMPNAAPLRRLLDRPTSILVGRPSVGKTRIAYLLGWFQSLLHDTGPLVGTSGAEHAQYEVGKLGAVGERQERSVLVLDECFGEHHHRPRPALVSGLTELDSKTVSIIGTASPGVWREAVQRASGLSGLESILRADELWSAPTLHAYARRRAPFTADDLGARIDAGELRTPDEIDCAAAGRRMIEEQDDYARELRRHLDLLRAQQPTQALLVALARMQAFSYGRPLDEIRELAGIDPATEPTLQEPWDLLTSYRIDDVDHVRLSNAVIVKAVDDWLSHDSDWLLTALAANGEDARWASDALSRWRIFVALEPTPTETRRLDSEHREQFSSELVEGALRHSPSQAGEVLEVVSELASDMWALRDASWSLVSHWEELCKNPEDPRRENPEARRAEALRDSIIADDRRLGAYGMLECELRRGETAPIDLTAPVSTRLLNLRRHTAISESARRQVALSFDALLWRRIPTKDKHYRELAKELLAAGRHDPLLAAALATAAAYHHDAACRLHEIGLRNPIDELRVTTSQQAEEMAWITAWHFLHQSRIRSLASRRDFRSTRNDPDARRTRYLDRNPRSDPLAEDHARAILRAAGEMARFKETAGWGVHLALNANATLGRFELPQLQEWLRNTDPTDPGFIGAAITYGQHPEVHELCLVHMRQPRAQDALLAALGEGLVVNGTPLRPPRFLAVSEPWKVRSYWQVDTEPLEALGLPFADPAHLVEQLRAHRQPAIDCGAAPANVDLFIENVASGDTRAMHAMVPREPHRPERVQAPGDLTQILVRASEELELRLFPPT